MRAESDTLTALPPLEVASYLRVHGWRQEAEIADTGSVWLVHAADGQDGSERNLMTYTWTEADPCGIGGHSDASRQSAMLAL